MNKKNDILVVFSDVDGTLVHYPDHCSSNNANCNDDDEKLLDDADSSFFRLPPSSTGMQGFISSQTLVTCQELRRQREKLVLVSGMRTSTLFKRLPFLPRADAYCCDAGGRIFYPVKVPPKEKQEDDALIVHPESYPGATDNDLEPFTLVEDLEWRQKMSSPQAAGTDGYIGVEIATTQEKSPLPVSDRVGVLWDFARELSSQGYVLDTKGYATCFRVNRKQQHQTADADENFDQLLAGTAFPCPPGLATSTNLGCIDYYPVASGKRNW